MKAVRRHTPPDQPDEFHVLVDRARRIGPAAALSRKFKRSCAPTAGAGKHPDLRHAAAAVGISICIRSGSGMSATVTPGLIGHRATDSLCQIPQGMSGLNFESLEYLFHPSRSSVRSVGSFGFRSSGIAEPPS